MKQCSPSSHNLNIQMYSFQEILNLFQLSSSFGVEELKRARMTVLKMHPDKSRLPPDYFLFYKKAFDVVVQYYNDQTKTTAAVPTTKQVYSAGETDKRTTQTVQKSIHEMGNEQFQQTFNQLFEKNMVKKPAQDANDWFKQNDPLYEFDAVSSTSGIAGAIESVKKKNAALVKYNGVETIASSGPAYGNLYDDDEDHSGAYVSSDPFSKLKYDDLRKVHKDQTVLSVSERDLDSMRTYSSMDHLQRERGSLHVQHVDRTESERILAQQESIMREKMAAKQHAAYLQTLEYAEKNKSVMATFLKLTNS